jgi:signal transduction histidine kinase
MEKSNFTILLVETHLGGCSLIAGLLSENENSLATFTITTVDTIEAAIQELSQKTFDVVLLDLEFPNGKGFEALEMIESHPSKTPIIVLTNKEDENIGLRVLQKHASDYLFKEHLTRHLLVRSIRYALERNETKKIVLRDISERKLAVEVLKRDKETLEKLIQDNSAKLIETQMELEKAKRLSDIGTLAATVAHELRNPLAAISISLANMRRKVKDDTLNKQFSAIEKKVAESDQIINNLLFYSRVKLPQYENIQVFDILNECIESAQEKFKKNITIQKDFDSIQGVSIQADPIQIKEVFYNLINNACDAVPDEGGEIKVSATFANSFLHVSIKDNGIGIIKEDLMRVFDPFFTTKTKGTGLGLTVCQKILKMHDASIGIESEPHRGTAITVDLPKK